MVVDVIKWRPWSPLHSKKYETTIAVLCLKGLSTSLIEADCCADEDNRPPSQSGDDPGCSLTKFTVEIRWKGSEGNGFGAFRRSVKRNFTREVGLEPDSDVVQWDEKFKCYCKLSGSKEGSFHPWEIALLIFNSASDEKMKKRVMVAGPAVLNLAEFVSSSNEQDLNINVPLTISVGGVMSTPSLSLLIHLRELRANQENVEAVRRYPSMPLPAPLSPCFRAPSTSEDDDDHSYSPEKSLQKVKSFTNCVSSKRRSRKSYNGGDASSDSKLSTGSEDSEYDYSVDTDSFDFSDGGSPKENKDSDNLVRKAVEYGTLVDVNLAGGGFDLRKGCDDGFVYYSNRKLEVEDSYNGNLVHDQSLKVRSPKLGILWRNRKLNFKPRRVKGEPLLKKEYGESGGDDIDFDRRQLSSNDNFSTGLRSKTEDESLPEPEFGDDNFSVGSWELKEIVTRDGSMRLQTKVFFASIDQRNVKAAGESACTVLVVLITDWLLSNQAVMITKSEFDGLIREGSLQWRNLCQDETLMSKFPDKHFDLDTVLEAGVCPLHEDAKKSFIGFFNFEEGMDEDQRLGFLHGAMSFDSIWDEIGCIASESVREDGDLLVYIVSWNDHFFVLKVDSDAYYIIDTLGERLFEGCNQAFVLKFDNHSKIERLPSEIPKENEKAASASSSFRSSSSSPSSLESLPSPQKLPSQKAEPESQEVAGSADEDMSRTGCSGKEACKEYIKSFLASIPIRELQADMKRGLIASTAPLHQRLQIEFHHMDLFLPSPKL